MINRCVNLSVVVVGDWTDWAGRELARLTQVMQDPSFSAFVYLCVGFGIFAFFAVVRAWRTAKEKAPPMGTRLRNWIIGGLVFLLLATWIYYDGKANRIAAELDDTTRKLMEFTGGPDVDPLDPPHPMHLKRLGGVYYRGNDERNSALFNGGFYRTAKLEVWIVDQSGTRLQWGDSVDGELEVEFAIYRAANTSSQLFSEQVMRQIVLTDSVETNRQQKIGEMVCDQPEQVWKARLPIGQPSQWVDQATTGKLFVVQRSSKPKPHYGIVFDIQVDDGKLSNQSELWMGSLYDLLGRVMIPRGEKILLDRWLDHRPIPEIVGPPNNDPELIGLPEHLGTEK